MPNIEKLLNEMTVDDLCGQLINFNVSGKIPYDEFEEMVKWVRPGGIFVSGMSVDEIKRYTDIVNKYAKVPVIVSADIEHGAGCCLWSEHALPEPMAWGACDDAELIKKAGQVTAEICRKNGIHWNFAPIVDINYNKDNTAGFHLDFLLHSGGPAYPSLFRYEKGRNTTYNFIGNSYFHKEGKGNINIYLDRYQKCLNETKDKGYIGMITGNHDMQRLAYMRDVEEVKAAMVFLFTMPGVPFVYYGDEIGMDHLTNIGSKEGGFVRTGARTPMQWNNKKNHGFSESDTPYIVTDERDGAPTVEDQINDENSLLSFVKNLIALRKSTKAFGPDADFKVVLPGYPFVFERMDGDKKLLVAINPSKYTHFLDLKRAGNIVLSQNVTMNKNMLKMDGVSFVIMDAV